MNRKTMMTITGVISIVFGVLMLLVGLFCFLCYNMATAEFIEEILASDPTSAEMTQSEIDAVVQLTRTLFLGSGIVLLLLSVTNIIMGSFLISKAGKKQNATGLLIAIIVINAISGNLITLLFAILSLCAKYPSISQNIDDPFGTKNPEIVLEDVNKNDDFQ